MAIGRNNALRYRTRINLGALSPGESEFLPVCDTHAHVYRSFSASSLSLLRFSLSYAKRFETSSSSRALTREIAREFNY